MGPPRRLPEALGALSVYDFGEQMEKQVRLISTGVESPFLQRGIWPGTRVRGRPPGSQAPSTDRQVVGASNRGAETRRATGEGPPSGTSRVSGGKAQGEGEAGPEGARLVFRLHAVPRGAEGVTTPPARSQDGHHGDRCGDAVPRGD